jgi:polyhydroxybutyrate depolymerase
MRRPLSFFVLGMALAAAPAAFAADPAPAATPQAGIFPDETIVVDGVTREYRLVVPSTVDLTRPAPLVFAFHGMGDDSKDHMWISTGLNDLAVEHKFILVYPGAITRQIPQGLVKAWALTPEHAAQDLAFFDALLARLEYQYKIDPNAIYLTGMSNGAYFAHLVARERSTIIAAIAPHSSELGVIDLSLIETGRKFPVLLIHGSADPIFPVESARQARDIYTAAGHEVKYVEVPGLGHEWAVHININEQIWTFFSAHPLPPPAKSSAAAK